MEGLIPLELFTDTVHSQEATEITKEEINVSEKDRSAPWLSFWTATEFCERLGFTSVYYD